MSQSPIINITIPVFNRPELTEQTIRAVKAHTSLPHVLTAVDNGSDDETRLMLLDLKKHGLIDNLFRLEKNFGVACAANVGWRMVTAPIYMKLDNDIVIHNDRWLELLLMQMKKFTTPVVMGGDFHNQLNNPKHVAERQGMVGRTCGHVSGGAILIPKDISDLAGYWCEDYGLYGCEDGDYGVRLHAFDIPQYYYDHRLFMKHLGQDAEMYRDKYDMDKSSTQDMFRWLWETNASLYSQKHRAPNVPLQYMPKSFDGYELALTINKAYMPMLEALIDFHNARIFEELGSQRVADTLNKFIGVQNATWEQATHDVDEAYARFAVG